MSECDNEEFTFLCPGCDESLRVNDSMRRVLLDRGCVICGTVVTSGAFTPAPPRDSR